MENKCLIVITGESYRLPSVYADGKYWGGGRRNRGDDKEFKSVDRQKIACLSHMKVIDNLYKNFNIKSDVFINTYKLNRELDNLLLSFYGDNLIKYNFHDNILESEQQLINDTITKLKDISINDYQFVLFFRIDFYLRDTFFDFFKIVDDKIMFAFVDSNTNKQCNPKKCSEVHHEQYIGDTFPMVSHQILTVPNKFYDLLLDYKIWNYHNSADILCKYTSKSNIDLFVYTYHYCSSDGEWNPFYAMVDRHESLDFFNKNYRFDIKTGSKIFIENDNIYDDLLGKDTIEEKMKLWLV